MDSLHSNADYDLRDSKVLESLWAMEENHFWFRGRNRFIRKALRSISDLQEGGRILDVGCGAGFVSGYLADLGYAVTGVDTASPLIKKAQERFPRLDFINARVGDLPESLRGKFNTLCFFDVLEHLDDPAGLLRAALPFGKSDCHIVVTVPARQKMFSLVDAASGHKKRYEQGELTQLFKQVGLQPLEDHFIFRAIYPILRARRRNIVVHNHAQLSAEERRDLLVSDTRSPVKPINLILDGLCAWEAKVGFPLRGGASLLGVARRVE